MMDKKIVVEMDQKVTDQQNTLEKAGVPGFYITTNPQVHFLLGPFSVPVASYLSHSGTQIFSNHPFDQLCTTAGAHDADEPA